MNDKKLMKIAGLVMLAIGLFLFLSHMRVTSFSFYRMGWAGIIMLVMGIDLVLMIVKPNKIFTIAMGVLAVLLIISIILNMRIYLTHMSMFKWIAIAICMFGGAGLTIKGLSKD